MILTSTQMLFVNLIIDTAIRYALATVEEIPEEELIKMIKDEEGRKKLLIDQLEALD